MKEDNMGFLDGKAICEVCAHVDEKFDNVKNKEGLIGNKMAYLSAGRCDKEYEDKGLGVLRERPGL